MTLLTIFSCAACALTHPQAVGWPAARGERSPLRSGRDANVGRLQMWVGTAGMGEHDVYGFEPVELPLLPSGERLSLKEMRQPEEVEHHTDDDGDDVQMWHRIQQYVARQDDDEDPADIGGEVWPAATALCRCAGVLVCHHPARAC